MIGNSKKAILADNLKILSFIIVDQQQHHDVIVVSQIITDKKRNFEIVGQDNCCSVQHFKKILSQSAAEIKVVVNLYASQANYIQTFKISTTSLYTICLYFSCNEESARRSI